MKGERLGEFEEFTLLAVRALGDGTYAVRFKGLFGDEYVRVDGDLPVDSNGNLLYGGLGDNPLNHATVGYPALLVSFTAPLLRWFPHDAPGMP